MATTQQQALTTLGTEPITAEQLLEMDAKGMRGELIRGVFCPTMSAGIRHGQIVMELGRLLGNAIADTRAGSRLDRMCQSLTRILFGTRHRLFSKEPATGVAGYAEVVAGIVIEVDADKARWINAGVQLVWVLWPETR